jgi:NAD(P)-dependent dehydrogenase (short-subunit alcohol dehydrogenase family)
MPAILEGKVALVTGVSRDGQVGQNVAKVLADNGAVLAICARTQSNVEERAEELRQAGARVLAVAASLTDEAQVRQLIERVLSEYKKIDILVNLAGGLTCYKPAVEHRLDDWNHERFFDFARSFPAHAGRWGRRRHQLRACRTPPGEHGRL